MDSLSYFLQSAVGFSVGFSLLGAVEVASVAFIVYYVYTKTRAPTIIAGLFPHLNININSSFDTFNKMGYLSSFLPTNNQDPKQQTNLSHGSGTQNLLHITPHAGRKPYNSMFDWGVYFPFIAQSFRMKQFPYPQVSGLVLKDPILQRAIKQASEDALKEENSKKTRRNSERVLPVPDPDSEDDEIENLEYQRILKQQEKRGYNILMDMRSRLNHILVSFTSWLLYKLLPCFLSGVVTHTRQIEMLKLAAEKAPGIPLIFLPLHRSHLDYIMVTFILANNDIRSPLVAAGNNLQIPVFGGLLRGLGAFFIKRKIDPVVGKKDVLYRAVLHLYLQHALKMGHNVEFFIEGGRTRTGKPCMPKGGILSVIVNAFMDRSIPDALLVPVSVNYERLVDGNFVREQLGQKKIPETFGKAMSGIWKALNSKYGLMRIDFNEPYSIRELVQSYNKIAKEDGNMKIYKPGAKTLQHNQSTSSLYGTDVVCEEHRTLIDSISRQVVYDCAAATSVMSTNALAFLLLNQFRSGALETDIAKELDALRNVLKGRRDMGFSGESLHVVRYACDLLGPDLVLRSKRDQQNYIQPNPLVPRLIELAYYSNTLTPHFALESIVLTSLHTLLSDKPSDAGISRKHLLEASLENCGVYRYEFILNKPTQVLDQLLESTIDELLNRELIKGIDTKEMTESDVQTHRMANNLLSYLGEDEYDDFEPLDNQEKPELFINPNTLREQKYICDILAPFAHSYYAVAQSLKVLYKNSMLESEFIKFVIKDITDKVNDASCPYGESISTDSVRNCLKLLEKWSVLEVFNQHGLRLLSLGLLYDSSSDGVQCIVNRIGAIVPKIKM
ncbi:glycerol-3-phosphate acyltransferase 1, mitochondrial isoform X1 [Episyrphus balteatus]|uniref:glycerol-3-phosphate acyltransferase 1, mitochondrial isoform X1 n=1 Tax=Episyrphus balteatus TaxID=286459 RepID=UPI00248553BB|nr:glycerol-3-phosphate acyltransferase 1, mitochondrial isoform X1 [Episyrphus balteatus]